MMRAEAKNALAAKIDAYLAEHKQEIVDTLAELVRIPSVGAEALPGMPYGKACDDMLCATKRLMEQHGFSTVCRNELGYTFSTYPGDTDKTVGLYAHGDVVPAVGDWQVCPPFEPIVKDGFLFGRGGNDDKSGIVEMLYATKLIRELGIPFHSSILMFTGVNEETGMGDIRAFIEHERVPDAGLVIDGACYPCDFGERTFYKFFLKHKKKLTTVKNFQGGTALSFNIILPEASATLAYTKECFEQLCELTARDSRYRVIRLDGGIDIKAKGFAAPVTTPESGKNAGVLLIELLLRCDAVCKEDKEILEEALQCLSDGYGKGLGIAHTDSKFGRLTCGNGIIRTEQGHLKLAFDVRAGAEFAIDELTRQTKQNTAKSWDYEEYMLSPGYCITREHPVRRYLERYYQYVMGEDAALEGYYFAGGTHARYLKNTVPVGNQNKLLTPEHPMPKGHGGYHQPDERLHIDSFVDAVKILVFLLMGMDEFLAEEHI